MNLKASAVGQWVLILAFAMGSVACSDSQASNGGAPAPAPGPDLSPEATHANKLRFEASVPRDQGAALNAAIGSLFTIPLDLNLPDVNVLATVLKSPDMSPQSLQSWVEARVQYIIKGDFDLNSHAKISKAPFDYQYPDVLPDAITKKPAVRAPAVQAPQLKVKKGEVVMLNIGAAIYAFGKQNKRLVFLDLPGVGRVPMTSPRTGLLQIGPGLFPDLGTRRVQNALLNIYRAGTLFHEARHSDGHGKTMGFMHSVCPKGHDYAGEAACDAATNGPYTVGSLVHKNLMNSCVDCTEQTKNTLQSIYLDIASRVLTPATAPEGLSPEAQAGVDWDDAPEGNR